MPLIKVTNGTNLFYKDWGSGIPVVFVHGWCINCDSWEYIMHDMAEKGFRSITYDQRGCGRSDQPWRGYDYITLADDLAALIERLDIDKVVLVGHSMGCGVIAQYLADYGDLHVLKAVMISTTTPYMAQSASNPNGIERVYFDADIDYVKRDRPGFVHSLVEDFFYLQKEGNTISPQMVSWAEEITMQASLRAAVEMRNTCYSTNQREELKQISIPVLLLHGAKDVSCPIPLTAEPTHDLLINSKLKIYAEMPHGMYMTEGAVISKDIMDFINQK